MRNKLADLLNHRKLKQMELAIETDRTACDCLRTHILQIDQDISKAARDADIDQMFDDSEERTQVIPVCSMHELVYGVAK